MHIVGYLVVRGLSEFKILSLYKISLKMFQIRSWALTYLPFFENLNIALFQDKTAEIDSFISDTLECLCTKLNSGGVLSKALNISTVSMPSNSCTVEVNK